MCSKTNAKVGIACAGSCLALLFTVGAVSAFGDPRLPASENRKKDVFAQMGGGAGAGSMVVGGMVAGGGGSRMPPGPTKLVTVIWEKPSGPPPFWLKDNEDEETRKIEEGLRQMLNKRVECCFNQAPLAAVVKKLSEETGIDFLIDSKGLEEESVTADEPIEYVRGNPVKIRDALAQLLGPLQLTYVIERESVVITSRSKSADTVRYYDLAFVLPDSSLQNDLLASLQTTIDSDCWQMSGGASIATIVGSMLIVSCPEETHIRIEAFLRAISKQSANNLKPTVVPIQPSASSATDKQDADKGSAK